VKRFCKLLKDDGMISIQTSHLTSVITICNYNEKQSLKPASKSPKQSSSDTSSAHHTDIMQVTNNNVNNDNHDNKTISSEPDELAQISFKCSKDEFFNVYQEDLELWETAYPAVDIKLDLNQMKVWLISNPTKIKTKRGMPKFITNWLSRTQNKGGNQNEKSTGNKSVKNISPAQRTAEKIQREFG